MGAVTLLRSVRLRDGAPTDGYPWDLPAVRFLERIVPHPKVTFVVGDNGTGKSTLIEAMAVAAGFNAEGGNRNYQFSSRSTESDLHNFLEMGWGTRPQQGWFLRAESFYNVATYIDDNVSPYFGGQSFHERSHGQSFIDLALARFHPGGFYLLDEPEAALSFHGCLRMLRIMHDTVVGGGQFVIATHSPVLLAYPEATIFQLSETGIDERRYDDVDSVELWRDFLAFPGRFLRHLLADDEPAGSEGT
jgi:predicted ATPase